MRFRQLLVVLIAFALYGALTYTGYRIFLMVFLLILFLSAASLIQLFWVRQRITVTQSLEQDPVFTGTAANLILQVVNQSRWPVAALEMEVRQSQQRSQPSLQVHQDLKIQNFLQKLLNARNLNQTDKVIRRMISVFGRSTYREPVRLQTDDARIFIVGITCVHIRDPFNLFRLPVRWSETRTPLRLRMHVLPQPYDKKMFASLHQTNTEGLHPSLKQSDEVNAITDLRKMRPGDSLKQIHWIVSAKQNQWMIKSFEKEEQGDMLLLPDLSHAHLPDRLHRRHRNSILSVSAAAIEQLLAADLALLLVTSDEQYRVTYAESSDQSLDLLIHLSATPDQPGDPLRSLVLEGFSRLPNDATAVLISAHIDEELIALVTDIICSGHPIIVIYYQDKVLEPKEPSEQFNQIMKTGARLIKVTAHETAR